MKYRHHPVLLAIVAALLMASTPLRAQDSQFYGPRPNAAAIASAHPLATKAGIDILKAGGNAFDAAVTVAASLAVVEPYGSGLGGGGFWLLRRNDGSEIMLDGRERAPLEASANMYLDADGNYQAKLSKDGPLAAGIPGVPAALEHLAKNYGRLPLATSLQAAIQQAEQGFAISAELRGRLQRRLPAIKASEAASNTFLENGELPAVNSVLKQPELARTLRLIAELGASGGFYQGDVAARMVSGVRNAGGIWSLRDLREYSIVERKPVVANYGDARIVMAAPPSSGGVALTTTLNIIGSWDWPNLARTDQIHLLAESWRRAYRDRAQYLGDPDVVAIPMRRLLSSYYADGLRAAIRLDKAGSSADLPGIAANNAGQDTTHYSIIDNEGNAVAATLSLNFMFGSGFMPAGTGVLLNNEMDDFAAKPGVANAYGLIGAKANEIAPGKRMLSSMTPTIVMDGRGMAVLGTPGGSRIITMVTLGLLKYLHGGTAIEMVSLPRFHHQFLPDTIFYEPNALTAATVTELKKRGHDVQKAGRHYGNMQVVIWDKRSDKVTAASDPRGIGAAAVVTTEDLSASTAAP